MLKLLIEYLQLLVLHLTTQLIMLKEMQLLRLKQIHLFSSLITLVLLQDNLLVQHILQNQLKTGMMSRH